MKNILYDNHGRIINYVRLAVTDRCNLRCFYCMPEEGINWLDRHELMTYEEMHRLCTLLVQMGISKIRITGGEPFVRKNIMSFLHQLSHTEGLEHITITTNGILTAPHVPELKKLRIHSVNLSLDTLDRNRFFAITRRDEFNDVMHTLEQLLYHEFEIKINAVVMDRKNIDDIIPLVAFTKDLPVSVRFIEEMPFNGEGSHYEKLLWDHVQILQHIRQAYPGIIKINDQPNSTSYNYQVPGHKGTIGIIAAYTRSFCGTCNRIRITPNGTMKTCLYDGGVLNVKDLMRQDLDDAKIAEQIAGAIQQRTKDGWEAERLRKEDGTLHESMATIGG